MKLIFTLFLFLLFNHLYAQTGPGGIGTTDGSSSLVLWLDANKNVSLAGSNVTSWGDMSGSGNNATPPAAINRPTFGASSVNGYPIITFDGVDHYLSIADNASVDMMKWSIFIVGKTNVQKDYNTFLSKGDDLLENYEFTSDAVGNVQFPIKYTLGLRSLYTESTGNSMTGACNIFQYDYKFLAVNTKKNNSSIFSSVIAVLTPKANANTLLIGDKASMAGYKLNGSITEIAIFDNNVNDAQSIIIHNYLAAKYNITLATNDMYTMDDPANGNFDHDIGGIGRVDASNIHNDSQGTGMVRILNPSGLGNNEFLMWGHDNGVLDSWNIGDVPLAAGVVRRLGRVWRASEQGEVGNVDVRMDLTGLGPVTASDLRLIVDTDNDGVFNDESLGTGVVSGATSLGGNVYGFAGVTVLNNATKFTIGSINKIQTPLPIELLSFSANVLKSEHKVELVWATASEKNNAYFVIERSQNLKDWENLNTIPGAGNSNNILYYTDYDHNPKNGLTYYRLKQVNIDQTFSYSKVISVYIDFKTDFLIIQDLQNHQITIESTQLENIELQVYNCLGQIVNVEKLQTENRLIISTKDLPTNIYYFKIYNDYSWITKKIMIH